MAQRGNMRSATQRHAPKGESARRPVATTDRGQTIAVPVSPAMRVQARQHRVLLSEFATQMLGQRGDDLARDLDVVRGER
jgi:hypothetical protein